MSPSATVTATEPRSGLVRRRARRRLVLTGSDRVRAIEAARSAGADAACLICGLAMRRTPYGFGHLRPVPFTHTPAVFVLAAQPEDRP